MHRRYGYKLDFLDNADSFAVLKAPSLVGLTNDCGSESGGHYLPVTDQWLSPLVALCISTPMIPMLR